MTLIYQPEMNAAQFCAANDLPAFTKFTEVCDHLQINYANDSARRVLDRFIKNNGTPAPVKINAAPVPAPIVSKPIEIAALPVVKNEVISNDLTPAEIAKIDQIIEAKKAPAPVLNQTNDLAALIAAAVAPFVNLPKQDAVINEGQIIDLIHKHGAVKTETLYVNRATDTGVKIASKHKQFDELLTLVSCGLNVWITGGAGGGKTHSVQQISQILNLPFYSKSISQQTSEFSFLGYMNAAGSFVETDFYKAYTTGGIFCLDEIDNGNPNILAVLNSALSNGHCSFANGIQTRHQDFICIATANTTGRGANQKYVGRLVIDGATLDRFTVINWEYDNNLETELCNNKEVAAAVQGLRVIAENNNLNCIISPRASINAARLVASGVSLFDALNYTIFNKLTDNEKQILVNA